MPIFKALLKVILEARAEVWLSHGTGTEYILIILFLSYERLVPFRSCMLPDIKNKCDKLSPNASRCNSNCTSEVLVTSPTAMLDTTKLWELWELTAKHNFIQIMFFLWKSENFIRLAETQKRFQGFGYLCNFRTLDLARIMISFMIHTSLCRNNPLNWGLNSQLGIFL